MLQIPGLCVLDCDDNLTAPVEYLRRIAKVPLNFYEHRCRYGADNRPINQDSAEGWERYVVGFNEAMAEPKVTGIFTDSLTGLEQMLLRWVMKKQGVDDVLKLERQHWIPFRMSMQGLSMRMRQTGKLNIVSAHENEVTDSRGTVIRYNTALTSRLRDNFGWIFTDVWYLQQGVPVGGQPRGPTLTCRAVDGLRIDLKSSFPDMPTVMENVTFADLNKYLKL